MLTSTLEVRKAERKANSSRKSRMRPPRSLPQLPSRLLHNYAFNIPKIVPGAYVLKLTVEDQLSQRSAIARSILPSSRFGPFVAVCEFPEELSASGCPLELKYC